MKLLLDTCVWGGAQAFLQAAGHDVVWCGSWPSDPGDVEILRVAREQGRVLVTLDKGFGELAVVFGEPHAGIVRLVSVSARDQGPACAAVIEQHGTELGQAAIVTVEPGRVRVRPRTHERP